MSRENVARMHDMVDAWNSADVERWLEMAHPELEWFPAIQRQVEGGEVVYTGEPELRRFFDDWHALWGLGFEVTETRDLGDAVLALARITTTGPASHVEVERAIGYVFEFEDGLLRRARAYLSAAEALEAVGLSE
jgi:ketosteroid isomerase-like protein